MPTPTGAPGTVPRLAYLLLTRARVPQDLRKRSSVGSPAHATELARPEHHWRCEALAQRERRRSLARSLARER